MLPISKDDLHGLGCLINAASLASAHVKEDLCEGGSADQEVQPQDTVGIFPFKATRMSISTPRIILRHIQVWTSLPWHFIALPYPPPPLFLFFFFFFLFLLLLIALVRSSEKEERGEEATRPLPLPVAQGLAAGGPGRSLGAGRWARST